MFFIRNALIDSTILILLDMMHSTRKNHNNFNWNYAKIHPAKSTIQLPLNKKVISMPYRFRFGLSTLYGLEFVCTLFYGYVVSANFPGSSKIGFSLFAKIVFQVSIKMKLEKGVSIDRIYHYLLVLGIGLLKKIFVHFPLSI